MAGLESTKQGKIERIQENLLAQSERKILNWLCARMPAWVVPDLLTTIGMVGAFMVFAGCRASHSPMQLSGAVYKKVES